MINWMYKSGSRMYSQLLQTPYIIIMMGTIVIGAMLYIIGYFIGRRPRSNKTNSTRLKASKYDNSNQRETNIFNSKNKSKEKTDNTVEKSSGNGGRTNKRTRNKKRWGTPEDFTHPWIVDVLKGHTGTVFDMDFSSNGKFLASCADDRTVHLWCTKEFPSKNRKSLRVNIKYDHAIHVRISPDGKAFIIHKSLGNNIEVIGLKKKPNAFFNSTISVLEFPKHHEENVVGMDIACNGRFIITCSKQNDVVIWNLKGEPLATINTHSGTTHQARISPCGRFIATSGFTPDVQVWEVEFTKTGEFKKVSKAFNLTGHSSEVYDFNFCSDSSLMASVSKDGTYRLYNTKIEFEKGEDPHLLISGEWEHATSAKLALSPNGEVLVVGSYSVLYFFSAITGKLDTTIENNGYISCMTFDASGEFLLVAVDRHIRVFRNITGYRVAIESARRKLEQRQTSATKERLEKTIVDSVKFLEAMGEQVP